MTDASGVVRTRDLVRTFGEGRRAIRAVDGVSLTVASGEIVVIMGPSGSGKTTLLSLMGALLRPTSGTVEIAGQDVTGMPEARLARLRARNVGFVFQGFNLLDALTVEENVLLPAQLNDGGIGAARSRAEELLGRLELLDRRTARPATLSGGEKQRVAIARALINRVPLVLADEPTGNLDSQRGAEVTMRLHDIARDEGCAVVIVTHDPRIEDVADRVLWLEDGRVRDRRADPHVWVRDPVCGMQVDEWTAGIRLTHAGRDYLFCSERCRERFLREPGAYVQDGGDRHRNEGVS